MTLSHRYEPLTQGWASHCEGHEDDLSKCTRDFDENAVKAVFISCSNSGTTMSLINERVQRMQCMFFNQEKIL